MNWTWFPEYLPLLFQGVWLTIQLLVLSMVFGLTLAVPVGLVQVTGPKWLALIARGYCTLMRGTPLLVQLWLLYFGLGSVFAAFPEVRQSIFWPILREGYFYAILAFTLNEGGYGGEIMRGAFLSVPKGELEAARAYGMSPWLTLPLSLLVSGGAAVFLGLVTVRLSGHYLPPGPIPWLSLIHI